MIQHEIHGKVHVPFANNRLFITFTLFLILGLPASFLPEENYVKWLFINLTVAIALTLINFFLWKKHQDDSKRYFSLHSLVMMMGMAFYMMTPVFKGLYSTIFFWLLLIGLGIFMFLLFTGSESIAEGLLNPRRKGFKVLLYTYIGIVLFSGSVLLSYMRFSQAAPWVSLAIVLFFLGLFLVMVSPAMLVTPERAIELRKREL